jgi:iron complex outermembrane recepter protein
MNVRYSLVVAAVSAAVFSQPGLSADANDVGGGQPSGQLEEIIVTAQKKEETLSKAPLAISAVSQDQLQAAGAVSVQDLPSVVPNVQVSTYPLLNQIQISIRGIASKDISDWGDPAVATYVDGIYFPTTKGLGGALYDLARVEVLRGPQGTLYGRNATAGSINIITADPEQNWDAATDISIGNYGDIQSHAMVNIPVGDTLAVRGAVFYHRNDGYLDTLGTTARNYEAADERAGRLTALWHPTEAFRWRVAVDNYISDGTQGIAIDTAPNGQPADGLPILSRPVRSTPEPYDHINNVSARSRMDWQANGSLSISYIAGYQRSKYNYATLYQAQTDPFGASIGNYWRNENSFQELDLNLNSKRLTNIFGITYAHSQTAELIQNPLYTIQLNIVPQVRTHGESWGVFDQASYRVTERFRLIGGARYSNDHKGYLEDDLACPVDFTFTGSYNFPSQCGHSRYADVGKWSRINWKAGIEYDLTDMVLSYLSATTGYKAGGFNNVPDPTLATYKPEDVINYEFGIKSRLFADRASINMAFFYQRYTNIQVTEQTVFPVTTNAAAARIYGLEFEGSWRMTEQDRVDVFATGLRATYTDYTNAVNGQTGAVVASLSSNHLPNAPDGSARIQYAHEFRLPHDDGHLTPSAAIYWQSPSYLREFDLPVDRVPSYTKTILRLTYQDSADHWQVEAFVNNVENKLVRIGYQTVLGFYDSYYGDPRTYGIRASYRY